MCHYNKHFTHKLFYAAEFCTTRDPIMGLTFQMNINILKQFYSKIVKNLYNAFHVTINVRFRANV